jgi:hypothetical protein
MDYLIHFVTNLDPNGGSSPWWPQYTTACPDLMTFLPSNGTSITQDTYRADGFDFIAHINLANEIYYSWDIAHGVTAWSLAGRYCLLRCTFKETTY